MSNAVLIKDEQKLNLTPDDLFDRIINLKINCYNVITDEVESFVIRSDYEMIYPEVRDTVDTPVDGVVIPSLGKRCIIRRCTVKPSIKVTYKMVTSNTGTNIEVFVSNFFMLTKDGKHLRSFNESIYKIESVEIAMGYWGQFRIGKESDYTVPTYDEYFRVEAKNGADKITMTGAIIVTTDKLPPDSVLHIKGYVGDIYSSPVAVSNIKSVENLTSSTVASSGDGLDKILFDSITRRYLNKHYFTDGAGAKLPARKKNIQVSDIATYGLPVVYDVTTGLIAVSDAEKYGVKVYLSDGAKEIKIEGALDSDGNEVKKEFYFEAGWTIGQTIARISTFICTKLNFTFNRNGDVLVYLASEASDINSLYTSFFNEGLYKDTVLANKALYNNKLPAVYNINVDAVATIVCPFFTFFEPFQYVEFASRYALTSLVGYFASYAPTIYRFLVISALVSFATVDTVNEVQITAVASNEATAN